MVGWHHQLNGHEFEQDPGDTEGQGSLACCSPWGCKELDTTEPPKNNINHHAICKKRQFYLIISNPYVFYFLLLPYCANTSSIMLNNRSERGYPCFI